MESVKATEAAAGEVAVSQSTRVRLDDIEAAIAAENTFVVGDAVEALGQPSHDSLGLLTVTVITMKNGFTVIGKTAPADPANFNADLGRRFSREDAIRQLWPLMGFALRDRLASA